MVIPQLDRAISHRPAIKLLRHPCYLADRIEEHFRWHRLVAGM